MGYTPQEFQKAFDKVSEKHSLTFTKARGVAEHFSALLERNKQKPVYEKQTFGNLIRLTLNEKGIWSELERKAYGSLIGTLYSPRAHQARKFQIKHCVPKKELVPSPSPNIIQKPNGQLAWEI